MFLCSSVSYPVKPHVDENVVSDFIEWTREKYGASPGIECGDLKVSRGKVHEFLVMKFDYTKKGCVTVSMKKFVNEIIEDFTDYRKYKSETSPDAMVIFTVRDNTDKLD